jgi:hypothetical protein
MCNIKEGVNKYWGNRFFITIISIIIFSFILLFASYLVRHYSVSIISDFPVSNIFYFFFYINFLIITPIFLVIAGVARLIKKNKLAVILLKCAILALSLSFLLYSFGKFFRNYIELSTFPF